MLTARLNSVENPSVSAPEYPTPEHDDYGSPIQDLTGRGTGKIFKAKTRPEEDHFKARVLKAPVSHARASDPEGPRVSLCDYGNSMTGVGTGKIFKTKMKPEENHIKVCTDKTKRA